MTKILDWWCTQSPTLATLRAADAEVHHGGRQVPRAAAAAQVGIGAVVLRVQRRGERRGEMQVAEVG